MFVMVNLVSRKPVRNKALAAPRIQLYVIPKTFEGDVNYKNGVTPPSERHRMNNTIPGLTS
jgi:hypothetical protein